MVQNSKVIYDSDITPDMRPPAPMFCDYRSMAINPDNHIFAELKRRDATVIVHFKIPRR